MRVRKGRRLRAGVLDRRLWVLVPVLLCAYTHMWNPAGFPDLYDDESAYIARGVGVLDGQLPRGHDHPFFGPVAVAGFMAAAGYPDVSEAAGDREKLESLYSIPRTFMGLLAVADAFLIYKIAERRYGPRAALLSSVLFAVMPASLVLRHVLLDSILLPLALLSVLLAMHAAGRQGGRAPLLVAAGACMGLAVLTKAPSLSMIPLAVALAWAARGRLRHAALYLAPAALAASAWPAVAAASGSLGAWLEAAAWQAGRSNAGLPSAAAVLFMTDPVTFALGAAGLAYALAARDRFLLLWFAPVLLFFGLLGYVVYYHLVLLLPAACMAAAVMVDLLAARLRREWGGGAGRGVCGRRRCGLWPLGDRHGHTRGHLCGAAGRGLARAGKPRRRAAARLQPDVRVAAVVPARDRDCLLLQPA